ncbi:hypothetical protein A7U43_28545 (plasmid) [Mycobacterium adipatum]|uniref:DUF4189 domain-containing protein n=1 Tax=Mycobacterium adipatum TaxID=1682113 RepID=A0A172UWK7_9MYCO|nr:DUF4189 domain-containing protein [Mycobacterium adipatum]ANE83462.1 hypothetical protein A7U43_28545 [Mycobacterium adipatum]
MTSISSRRVAVVAAGVVAASALATVVGPQAGAARYYGAIAYATNGAGASVWSYPSRADAEDAALDYCGYSTCKVLVTFSECGAVAFDGDTLQGGSGSSLFAAINDAKSRLPGSWVESWACN